MAGKLRWAIPLIVAAAAIFLITVTGSASAASITGMVTDTNGIAVSAATVTLYQNGSEYPGTGNPARTNAAGYYLFTGLTDGTYSIQADAGGYFSPSDSRILAGNDVEVNLRITGYDSKAARATIYAYDTPTPTPTPTPTAMPTKKVTPTVVPLPTPEPSPGFGMLLALVAIGLIAAARKR
jgi:protocatechuate 3,4-dioxygenase beta subunit